MSHTSALLNAFNVLTVLTVQAWDTDKTFDFQQCNAGVTGAVLQLSERREAW